MLFKPSMPSISRRRFLRLGALALPVAFGIDARLIEPTNLRVTTPKLKLDGKHRFVHFSDFHHKGDVDYAADVINTINKLEPEFVCFTGDLVEDTKFLGEALGFIEQIKAPVYGSPGNHDYWSRAPFSEYERTFAGTGGRWLVDDSVVLPDYNLELIGMGSWGTTKLKPPQAGRRILLSHYPKAVDDLGTRRFDLILAGHSHGGQVRIPGYGAIAVPWGVGRYDLGYFETNSGPLYVNAGIGTYRIPWRFNCRPEITVLSI
jgi:predicted MPP superfamily phosphohydrolase